MPVCEAIDTSKMDFQKFSQTVDIAANPTKHFEVLEDDIKMHGKSIMQDIKDAVGAYKHGQYESFGEIMGNVLKVATEVDVEEGTKPVASNYKDVYPKENREMLAEIFQGFMESTGVGSFNFTNLLLCIYEADQSALELY